MKFQGIITDLETSLDEFHHEIREAVVTKDRIAIDWEEDGETYHATLRSNDGGITYKGNYGSPQPCRDWVMEATKYAAANKSILLLVKWHQSDNGYGGTAIFELEPLQK